MGHEASKTRSIMTEEELNLFEGKGIDIGCGLDPIMKTARPFDMEDGDANKITEYVDEQYDYVFSSHCLEHMHNPVDAIQEWWKIVKPNGHLIFTVPDEDLYEQGYFPSFFNDDHKSTFTLSKRQSWSNVSYNLLDLVQNLPQSKILKIELQDNDYNRGMLHHSVYTHKTAQKMLNFVRRFSSLFKMLGLRKQVSTCLAHLLRLPMDQSHNEALAQIFVIVQKVED